MEASPLSCLPLLHGQSEMLSVSDAFSGAQITKSFSSLNRHIPFLHIVFFEKDNFCLFFNLNF